LFVRKFYIRFLYTKKDFLYKKYTYD
jgi:hypothetical protein